MPCCLRILIRAIILSIKQKNSRKKHSKKLLGILEIKYYPKILVKELALSKFESCLIDLFVFDLSLDLRLLGFLWAVEALVKHVLLPLFPRDTVVWLLYLLLKDLFLLSLFFFFPPKI